MKFEECVIKTPGLRHILISENLLIIGSLHHLNHLEGEYVRIKIILNEETRCLICRVEIDPEESTQCALQPLAPEDSMPNGTHCQIHVDDIPIVLYKVPVARVICVNCSSKESAVHNPRILKSALVGKTLSSSLPIRYCHGGQVRLLKVTIKETDLSQCGLYRVGNLSQFALQPEVEAPYLNSHLASIFHHLRDDVLRTTMRGHISWMMKNHNLVDNGHEIEARKDKKSLNAIAPVTSMVVSAPSGSGIRHAVLNELKNMDNGESGTVNWIEISIESLLTHHEPVNPETNLRALLQGALLQRPCVVYIDRLEAVAPNTKLLKSNIDQDAALTNTTQAILEFCRFIGKSENTTSGVLLVCRTEHTEHISPAILNCVDEVVTVSFPNIHQRKCILDACIAVELSHYGDKNYKEMAVVISNRCEDILNSIVGLPFVDTVVEYAHRVKEVANHSIDAAGKLHIDSGISTENAIIQTTTSVQRKVIDTISLPRQFALLFSAYNILPPTAVLLHGPPGTGKTWIAAVLGQRLAGHFISVRLSDILSGHVGVAEGRVRDVFSEAMQHAPAIVFIDEFQALFTSRDGNSDEKKSGSSLTSTLSGCLDDIAVWNSSAGLGSLVTVIAATNEPWAIDVGFLRPGRFDKILYVGPMEECDRLRLIASHLTKLRSVVGVDVEAAAIASRTSGFTAADIGHLFQCISELYIDDYMKHQHTFVMNSEENRGNSLLPLEFSLSRKVVDRALETIHPSCSHSEVSEYIQWENDKIGRL